MTTLRWMKEADRQVCRTAVDRVIDEIPLISRQAYRFLQFAFDPLEGAWHTVNDFARAQGVKSTTMACLMWRAKMPGRMFLDYALAVRAFSLLENRALTISTIAVFLQSSGHPSFHRRLKLLFEGKTITELRRIGYTGRVALEGLLEATVTHDKAAWQKLALTREQVQRQPAPLLSIGQGIRREMRRVG